MNKPSNADRTDPANTGVSEAGVDTSSCKPDLQSTAAISSTLAYRAGPNANEVARTMAYEPPVGLTRPTIEGYAIIDELGRGGMGVVYRAKQLGLGRFVAIKMLLAGEHAGPEQLTRFQLEAQAVASLQHPNIVQIYEVGAYKGLPYFSLEFVPGGSLSQKIAGQPQLPIDSARLVETIARAIHVAHQLGIVHRDLKPANILLAYSDHSSASAVMLDPSKQPLHATGPLRTAIPKISDFGLAKQLELDSRQTRSGTIMGSPSYMAPEQARGDVRQIGPLADVYAIGTILYELLTGRPPFLAATAIDTVHQVVNAEPVPPSRLEPKLPRDLETICLKCLQKDPRKRYVDAQALADDLRHFQQGEPILARPVSSGERLWRWCRRNPWLASASAVALLLLVLTATISSWAAVTLAQKNGVISHEKEIAVAATHVAETRSREAVEARRVADANAKTASEQATLAVRTIQLLVQKVQQRLSEAPGTQAVRKEILDLANAEIARVADKVDSSTSKEATRLAIHVELGLVFKELGESEKAFDQFSKAESLARERIVIKQGSDASRANLAFVLVELGEISQEFRRDMQQALRYYEEVVAIHTNVLEHPYAGEGDAAKPFVVRKALAEGYMRVGATIYRIGDPGAAMGWFRRGLDVRRELVAAVSSHPDLADLPEQARRFQFELPLLLDLSRSLLAVGDVNYRLGNRRESLELYREGLAIREQLAAENPKILGLKHELARTYGNLGEIHQFLRDLAAANDLFGKFHTLMQELVGIDGKSVAYQRDLALSYYRLGAIRRRAGNAKEAQAYFEQSREVRQALAIQNPSNDRRQMELMLALARCGEHAQAAAIAEKYASVSSPDNEILLDVTRCLAQCTAAVNDRDLQRPYAEQAVAALTAAIGHGYLDVVYLESEPDLDPLRDRADFQSLVEHLPRGR